MSNNNDLGVGTVEWAGTTYRTILSSEETDGAMSITDSVSPDGSGPPRHIHHDADETFYVLTGECEVWIEGETLYRSAGEAIFIPRGKEHTFRVTGGKPSRHLVILTPGGFEGFFHEMAREGYAIPTDMPQIVEAGERFKLTFTGPPLGA